MSSRGSRWLTLLVGVALGAGITVVGLAQAGRLTPERPELLVPVAQTLDAEHRAVRLLVERGEVAQAIAALEGLRAQPWPTRAQGGELAVLLRHDAYGRLLRMRLDHADVDPRSPSALLDILHEGLGSQEDEEVEPNPFTARLYALQGEILEQLGRDDDALTAYEKALEINRILLERELGGSHP